MVLRSEAVLSMSLRTGTFVRHSKARPDTFEDIQGHVDSFMNIRHCRVTFDSETKKEKMVT